MSVETISEKYQMNSYLYKILSGCNGYVSHRKSGVLSLRCGESIERNKKIVAEVEAHPDVLIAEIAAKYNISPSKVYTVLRTR